MMRYAYFPGCSAHSTGMSYTMSTDYVAANIGFEMVEIPDWNCCGTSAARLTSYDLGNALPARSLALSEQMDPDLDIVAPCAGCYQALKASVAYSRESEENLRHVQEMIQMPYEAKADVVSLLEAFVQDDVKEAVAKNVSKPLGCLKVACYYGCALVRPAGVCKFDDPEDPTSMDELMRIIGAEPVEWAFKTECCGASTQMTTVEVARPLIENIFQNAAANGADCIATACPLCWLNLDMRAEEMNKRRAAAGKPPINLPVYYFTELIGRSQGGSASELGLDIHFQEAVRLLEQKEVEAAQKAAEEKAAAEEAQRKAAEREARMVARKAEKAAKAAAEEEGSGKAETGGAAKEAQGKQEASAPAPEGADAPEGESEKSEEVGK